jgi:hypothetical protein
MNNMKKTFAITCAVATIMLGTFAASFAAPMPTDSNSGKDYFLSVPDLHTWSCGLSLESSDRNLKVPDFTQRLGQVPQDKYRSVKTLGFVGYDFEPWFEGYVTAGLSTTKINPNLSEGNNGPAYGIGVHFNIIDKDIINPTLADDKIRVTAGAQYLGFNGTDPYTGKTVQLGEFSGSALIGIVNDVQGSKEFLPNSIGIFGGLIFSYITNAKNVMADETIGFMGGLNAYYTESVSFVLAVEQIGGSGYLAGVNVRF